MRLIAFMLVGLAVIIPLAAAMAAETVTYSYDARGRLVKTVRTGTVNNNVKTEFEFDKGDNRKRVKVTKP